MKIQNLLLMLGLCLFIVACGDDDDDMTTCDSDNVTYTNGAAAILNTSCVSAPCHGANSTAGTFPMNDYASALAAVGFDRIIGAINHTEGFTAMPLGGTKLADCDIEILTNWINDGAPE